MRLPRQLEALSRLLSYVLCHRPDEFGLVLDEDGFIPIKKLLQGLAAEPGWGHVRRHHLEQLAGLCQPPCLEIAGDRIRGVKPGPARLRHAPGGSPPALLYIAVPVKAHAAVAEQGLRPPPGQELVLAADRETALKIARRRSPDPVMIVVQARLAADRGIVFQGYGENLWLTSESLPREFLQVPPVSKEPERPKPTRPAVPLPSPGSPWDFAQLRGKAAPASSKSRKDKPDWKIAARRERRKRRP
jgi:putative RNA 2'-phosphotransferase|uniref:RNA 2'-phosphotransferase n=1 Tax=Desulfobacca acetoxidans TaxID=60893 RepID=A0A7C3WGY6_9BACT